jgi:hypothetical protein
MYPWIEDVFLDGHGAGGECSIGRFLVARIPGEDVIVVLARAMGAGRFTRKVLPQDGCVAASGHRTGR